jgi:hypothetical protein
MVKRENLGFLFIVGGIIVFLSFTIFGNFVHYPGKLDPETLSKYGGFIGGTVGSLFTLAGFLIIYEGFRIQKRQLFESTFFNLFIQYNDFRFNQIGLVVKKEGVQNYHLGYEFFQIVFEEELGLFAYKSTTTIEKIIQVLKLHANHIGRLLGHVNIIVYYIESNSELKNNEKEFYYSYLMSQLSEQEKFLIHFHDRYADFKSYSYLNNIIHRDKTDYNKFIISPVANKPAADNAG